MPVELATRRCPPHRGSVIRGNFDRSCKRQGAETGSKFKPHQIQRHGFRDRAGLAADVSVRTEELAQPQERTRFADEPLRSSFGTGRLSAAILSW